MWDESAGPRWCRRLILPAVLSTVLAACASQEGAINVAVQPIEEILASDVEVTPDASGRSATVAVKTAVPGACAVIYGTDADLGAVAVDSDMDGGAHNDHAPVLTGLEPDTDYQFVLQGSDTSGALYRSQTMTFTTPAASEEAALGTNVAIDASVAGVSSEFSDDFAATQAIDGDPATAWATAGDGDGAWIELDLGQPTELVGVRMRSRSMTDGSSIIQAYTVTVDQGQTYGPFEADVDGSIGDLQTTGQRLRLEAVQTTGGNTGAAEIDIYAVS